MTLSDGHHWQLCGCQDCETYRAGLEAVQTAQENTMSFVSVSREEMRAFIAEGKSPPDRWEQAGREQVAVWTVWLYDRRLPEGLVRHASRKPSGLEVKLYTSFAKGADTAREYGSDAIRVALVGNNGFGHRYPHIKRTDGWQTRLKERLHEAFADAKRKLEAVEQRRAG